MNLVDALIARGVEIPCPGAVVVRDVDPERFEPGVVIHPGCTVEGAHSLLGAGTSLGRAGGGWFRNVRAGRNVDLYGGTFDDCVFLDGVTLRGSAEVRGGTLLEERCEGAHHVGFKMTVMLPCVVAGSLINFCDALVSGGTSRADHSEIGSCLALYNFSPWGDKFASQFGDVPAGVFMRSPRIFVGGQAQIVSPVHVGFGAVIPAGAAVRRSVGAGRILGEPMQPVDATFDPVALGGLEPKFALTASYIGNLHALDAWYVRVRLPNARDDFERALHDAARLQIRAGIAERIKRLGAIIARLPESRRRHLELQESAATPEARHAHARRIAEHDRLAELWPGLEHQLRAPSIPERVGPMLDAVAEAVASMSGDWLSRIEALPDDTVSAGEEALRAVVDACAGLSIASDAH